MKNSDLTRLIKSAYAVESSEKKNEFIRKYQKRELNYPEMLFIQLQYMGIQLTAVCGYALAALLGAAAHIDEDFAKLISVLAPAFALIALTGLGKSAKYGMEELEMSSRFSMRMLKAIRLAIIGIAGLVIMLTVSCTLKLITGTDMIISFALVGVPYLITTFLCMLLIRRWHSPKNIYGCIVIALVVCIAMSGSIELLESCSAVLRGSALSVSLAVSIILTAAEFCRYINESEELQWNLC